MSFPRHSQARPDNKGNLRFLGDKYVAGRTMGQLVAAVLEHLEHVLASNRFRITKSTAGHRRRLDVSVTRSEADLTDQKTREDLLVEVHDETYRFGYDRSNEQTDLYNAAFTATASVDPAYWALRQRQIGAALIADRMKASAFRRTIRPGDTLEVLKGENVGRKHRVLEVASRIVTDNGQTGQGRFYWDFPITEAFLCDGDLIRIAKGTTKRPDDYQLLRWVRHSSA